MTRFQSAVACACALAAFAAAEAAAQAGIDDPAHWAAARAELAALGEGLIAWETNRDGPWRIYGMKLAGGKPFRISANHPGREHYAPHLSPDGRRLTYVSMDKGVSPYGKIRGAVRLHLVDLQAGDERMIVDGVSLCPGGNRAVTWIDAGRFYFLDARGRACIYDLAAGKAGQPVLTNGGGHLPNPTGTYAADRHRYYRIDAGKRALGQASANFGGCEPTFSHDGTWAVRMSGAGGPATRIRLADGKAETILDKNDDRMPAARRYIYFPMPSPCQRLLAFAASPGQHDHNTSDYDVFVAPIDPQTLMLTGRPVRMTFDKRTDRYPTVWLGDLDLKEHRGEAPLTVALTHPAIRNAGDWQWDYGDAAAKESQPGRPTFRTAGTYTVTARNGQRQLRGRVVVRPASPPKPLSALLAGPTELHIVFDEPIDASQARLTLTSGVEVARLQACEHTLVATLRAKPANPDTIHLSGVRDLSQGRLEMAGAELSLHQAAWPVARDGLLFAFDTASAEPIRADGADGDVSGDLTPRGRARLDRHRAMVLDDGAFVADAGTNQRLLKALRGGSELTIEALLTTRSADQSGPARIASFSADAGSRNFTLGQEKGDLVLRLRTPRTGTNGVNPSATLFAVAPDRPVHVVVTYRDGQLVAYRDGKPVVRTGAVRGDFANWQAQQLIFGDEASGDRNWNGTLEAVAIYGRALNEEEVDRHWKATQARLAARKPLPAVRVKARLVAASDPPTLEQLGLYRHGLIVHEWEVVESAANGGLAKGARIRVVDWAILDRQSQPASRLKRGHQAELLLEPYDAQPQLIGLFRADSLEPDAKIGLYYIVPG